MSDELFLYLFYSTIAGYALSVLLTYPLSKKYQIPLENFNIASSTVKGAVVGIVFGVVIGCFFLFKENNLCGMISIITAPVGMILGEFLGVIRPIYIATKANRQKSKTKP